MSAENIDSLDEQHTANSSKIGSNDTLQSKLKTALDLVHQEKPGEALDILSNLNRDNLSNEDIQKLDLITANLQAKIPKDTTNKISQNTKNDGLKISLKQNIDNAHTAPSKGNRSTLIDGFSAEDQQASIELGKILLACGVHYTGDIQTSFNKVVNKSISTNTNQKNI